jgi:glycosyltransferase involved in cell wall biosynthesis
MRIALIHYRLTRQGGLETRLFNYVNWFLQKGHQVTLIYARTRGNIELPSEVELIQSPPGIAIKPFRRIVFSNKVKKILSKRKFDFSLSLGRTVGQDAVLAAANHRGFLKALGKRKWGLSDWSQDRMDLLAFQESRVVFAASEMMKSELIDLYGINPKKIHVLFPPIQLYDFKSKLATSQTMLKREIGMKPEKTSFCFVSTSHYRKGLDILLKVFEKLPSDNYELFVAGDDFRTNLPHVHKLGFLKDPSVLYAAADFYLHPARFEPFGQVVTESLQSGTPVLVSHQVGAKEILSSEVGKVIPSLDWKDWYDVISRLKKEDFSVPMGYVQNQKLGLDDHLTKMLQIMELEDFVT